MLPFTVVDPPLRRVSNGRDRMAIYRLLQVWDDIGGCNGLPCEMTDATKAATSTHSQRNVVWAR